MRLVLTGAGGAGGVLGSSVEALVTVTDAGRLVVAGAVWRALGALDVACIRFVEAWFTRCGTDRQTDRLESDV